MMMLTAGLLQAENLVLNRELHEIRDLHFPFGQDTPPPNSRMEATKMAQLAPLHRVS
ncbi:MAG: hypothetical protein GHCLOJNM_01806 [bacterium]|nr:hypothetical protein [bacterium]